MSLEIDPEPPTVQKRRPRIIIWLVRGAMAILVIFLLLAITGTIYQSIASALDQRNYPAPGRLVSVGDYKLHILCKGEGSPTVILEAANQGTVSNWVWIQSRLAEITRVCAYDRAGLGWSDLSPEPQDTRQNAEALHTLLNNAQVEGPYVLVGHSFGGLYVRMFAELYPDEVAGMVLIEGTLPDGLKALGLPDVMPNAPGAEMMDGTPLISRLGILRLLDFPPTDPDLPEKERKQLKAYLASTKWAEAIKRQYYMFPTLLDQVRPLYKTGSLGDLPLAVVLGSEGDGSIEAWSGLFDQQAEMSKNGVIYRIEGANHVSLVDAQEHADHTSAVIVKVIQEIRKKR